jgi:hypothetical protein
MKIVESLIDRIERAVEPAKEQAMDYEAGEGKRDAAAGQEARAASVSVGDFSEQLTAGVLRAIDAHVAGRVGTGTGGAKRWPPHPVIWCGIWVRPPDFGPFDQSLMTEGLNEG